MALVHYLFLSAILVAAVNAGSLAKIVPISKDGGEIQKNTIHVQCKVPHGQCKIKCWSGDDIMGPNMYEIGEEMAFSFTGVAWTKFWCEAWWGENAYVTHPAYDAGAPRQSNIFEVDKFGSNLINWTSEIAWRWQGVPPPAPEE